MKQNKTMSNNSIKRLWVAIIVIFACTSTVILANTNQDKKFVITLSEQELNIVMQGLGKIPLESSQPVYMSIMQQAQLQLQAAQQKPVVNKADTTKKKQ